MIISVDFKFKITVEVQVLSPTVKLQSEEVKVRDISPGPWLSVITLRALYVILLFIVVDRFHSHTHLSPFSQNSRWLRLRYCRLHNTVPKHSESREHGVQQWTLMWRIPTQAHNTQPSVSSTKQLPVEQIGLGVVMSSLAPCSHAGYVMPSMQIVRSFHFELF